MALLFWAINAPAANRTWDGSGNDNNWRTGSNWVGNSRPNANDLLFFAGTTQLTANNNFTAGTTFNGLTFNTGAGAFILSGNGISLGGGITNNSTSLQTINLALTLTATRNIDVVSLGSLTIGGAIGGAGFGITKTGGGTLTLSGVNTYSGLTTISAGVVNAQNNSAFGTTAGGVTVTSGAALQLLGGTAIGVEALTLRGSGISGGGALRNVSGNNSWGGALTLGPASTIASDSGTLTLSGAIANGGFLATFGGAGNAVASGVISGSGGLTKTGAGTLSLSGANIYGGTTTINSGKIKVQNNSALGNTTGATTVAGGAAIQIDGTGLMIGENITINGDGDGSGALENLLGLNTGSGAIAFGSAARINSTAGTLTLSGATISGNGHAMTFGGAGNIVISSVINGTGSPLIYDGNGTLTLSGANSYTGDTTVSAGTLQLGANNAIPNGSGSGNVSVSVSGLLDLAGFSQMINGLSGVGSVHNSTGSGQLTAGNANASSTFGGVISGAMALTKTGTGTLTLGGANNYTGGTTLSRGTLRLSADNALGTGGLNFAGGVLEVNNTIDDTIGALTLSADSTLSLGVGGSSGRLTFTSASAGAVGILTITGWSGSAGGTGTDDQIFITADPTASGMLDHIIFDLGGGDLRFAEWIAGSHELVASVTPVPEPANVALGVFGTVFVALEFRRRLCKSERG